MIAGIVVVELADPPEVGFDGTLAEPFELDKPGVMLIPLVGGDDVMLTVFFA